MVRLVMSRGVCAFLRLEKRRLEKRRLEKRRLEKRKSRADLAACDAGNKG